jgi:hypothetical protein
MEGEMLKGRLDMMCSRRSPRPCARLPRNRGDRFRDRFTLEGAKHAEVMASV